MDPVSSPSQADIFRSMTPAQRLEAAFDLHDFAVERLRISLRREHPDHSEREIDLAVARRFLGDAARVL